MDDDPTSEFEHPHITVDGEVAEIAGAPARLPEVFAMLDALVDGTLEHTMKPVRVNPAGSHRDRVLLEAWNRAFNTVKAIRLLMTQDFWELAQPLIRQLFELLVNIEEIERADDKEDAAAKFVRFGILQRALGVVAVVDYEELTGRASEERLALAAKLRHAAGHDQLASEFWFEDRNKRMRRHSTWCGRNVREMAVAGGQVRSAQYEIIYRAASMESHASPGALTGTKSHPSTPEELVAAIDSENKEITQTAALATTFFIEIWHHAQDAVDFPGEMLLGVTTQMMTVLGQPIPD